MEEVERLLKLKKFETFLTGALEKSCFQERELLSF